MRPRALWIAALITFLGAGHAAAQGVLSGRIVDERGAPIAGQTVVLHGVTGDGGAALDRTISAADGSFQLKLPATLSAQSIVFAAAQIDGRVYLGAALSGAEAAAAPYELRVAPATAADALLGAPAQAVAGAAEKSSAAALLVFLPLVAVTAGILHWMRGDRTRAGRAELLELARMEAADPRAAALRARLTGTEG